MIKAHTTVRIDARKPRAKLRDPRAAADDLQRRTEAHALRRVRQAAEKELAALAREKGEQIAPERLRARAKAYADARRSSAVAFFRPPESTPTQELGALAAATVQKIREALEGFRRELQERLADRRKARFGPEAYAMLEKLPLAEVLVDAPAMAGDAADFLAFAAHPPSWVRLPTPMPRPEWTPIDLLLHQVWGALNGTKARGDDPVTATRCRVCDAKLVRGTCEACGATGMFAEGLLRGGKARPRELALLLILGDTIERAQWLEWSREGQSPESVQEVLAKRIRTSLGELRKALRKRRREIVSHEGRPA